jgi:GT2 family glycosyltransferase
LILNNPGKSVWVVIPTWNRCQDLLACLESLATVNYSPLKILVVDNASEDGSVEAVNKRFPWVELIQLNENVGAPSASNVGFDFALDHGADFILRLDSDTVVNPDFLTPLVDFAVENPNIGVISPKIYYANPSNVIWYAGVDAHPFHFGAINDFQNQQDSQSSDYSRIVDYAWGAAMLIRREVLEKIGGFDPKFFIYYEEVDFCKRVQQIGFQIYYFADSKIWHKVGILNPTKKTAYQWNRSKMILFNKQARNIFHRIALIHYAYLYAIGSLIIRGNNSGNRGPLKSALKGLSDGLCVSTSKAGRENLVDDK